MDYIKTGGNTSKFRTLLMISPLAEINYKFAKLTKLIILEKYLLQVVQTSKLVYFKIKLSWYYSVWI